MNTDELIKALRADGNPGHTSYGAVWWGAAALAAVLAALAFYLLLGPRPDIEQAARTPRFLFKFVATIALAVTAFPLVRDLSRPGAKLGGTWPWLLVAPLLLFSAVVLELFALPASEWAARWTGSNMLLCMTFIPLIGIAPLAVFVLVLREGAPTRPGLAGAAAGLLAGGIAATFYAAHCTDDSPLFVASWYSIAVGGLSLVGAVAARRFARW